MPGRVHCFVFCRSDGKEFGQFHTESNGDISVLAHHTALLYGEQRELRFQGLLFCFYFFGQRPQQYVSLLRFLWLKVTDKVADRTAVHKVAWVQPYRSFLHQSVLPVLSVHGERLPHHKAGPHYTYDKTGYLTDATEIEHDNENEDSQQSSCKEEEILCLQALELYRPAYTLVDFKCCHRLTGRNFSG